MVERLQAGSGNVQTPMMSSYEKTLKDISKLMPTRYSAALAMSQQYGDAFILASSIKGNVSEFSIKGKSNSIYSVKITEGNHSRLSRDRLNRFRINCSCPDFSNRKLRSCKHGQYCLIRKLCFNYVCGR